MKTAKRTVTVYINEFNNKEFFTEKECQESEKTMIFKHTVTTLHQWGFWHKYQIAPIQWGGRTIENLGTTELKVQDRSILLGEDPVGGKMWVKVSIKGWQMNLMLYSDLIKDDRKNWKFLGRVDLRKVGTSLDSKAFNYRRNRDLLAAYDAKNSKKNLINSALNKLTAEEKLALGWAGGADQTNCVKP